jgi:hypothetical protein
MRFFSYKDPEQNTREQIKKVGHFRESPKKFLCAVLFSAWRPDLSGKSISFTAHRCLRDGGFLRSIPRGRRPRSEILRRPGTPRAHRETGSFGFTKETAMTKLTSFQADIRPLFTQRDIDGMKKGFNLASYDEVKAHGAAIYDRIRGIGGALMPPPPPRGDGPWPQSNIELFAKWMADGYQP